MRRKLTPAEESAYRKLARAARELREAQERAKQSPVGQGEKAAKREAQR